MSIKNKIRKSTAGGIFTLGLAAVALPFTITSADANGNTTEKVTASQTVTLRADIPKLCKFGSGFGGNINIPLDEDNGKPHPIMTATASTNITCNTSADVELESEYGGMVHEGVHVSTDTSELGDGYLTSFDYTATLSHGGSTLAELDTANGSIETTLSTGSQPGFTSGNVPHDETLDLEIQAHNTSSVLQAGNYTDNLTVKVIPK